MLLLVTFLAKRHQVPVVQCDCRITKVLRRDMCSMMHVHRRNDQPFAETDLAQTAAFLNK